MSKKQKENRKRKITVMGTEWKFHIVDQIDDDCDGLTRPVERKIEVLNPDHLKDFFKKKKTSESAFRHVIRHELLHAVFFELGHRVYAEDEELVDLLAKKWPEIEALFEEMGVDAA